MNEGKLLLQNDWDGQKKYTNHVIVNKMQMSFVSSTQNLAKNCRFLSTNDNIE